MGKRLNNLFSPVGGKNRNDDNKKRGTLITLFFSFYRDSGQRHVRSKCAETKRTLSLREGYRWHKYERRESRLLALLSVREREARVHG